MQRAVNKNKPRFAVFWRTRHPRSSSVLKLLVGCTARTGGIGSGCGAPSVGSFLLLPTAAAARSVVPSSDFFLGVFILSRPNLLFFSFCRPPLAFRKSAMAAAACCCLQKGVCSDRASQRGTTCTAVCLQGLFLFVSGSERQVPEEQEPFDTAKQEEKVRCPTRGGGGRVQAAAVRRRRTRTDTGRERLARWRS